MTGNGSREARPGTPAGRGSGGASRRTVLLWALLVVAAQAGVMAAAFNPSPHTGGDNAGYLNLAHSLLERGAYLDLHDPAEPGHTKYPPVFPAVLAGAMLLGARSWVAFKALSALFTTLGVLFAFLWINERRGPVFGASVALILVFSEAMLWSSQWILSDPPFVALTFLSLWALERSRRLEADGPAGAPGTGSKDAGDPPRGAGPWLILGAGVAILAYFTRSAGLPLIVAVAGSLALGRRWPGLVIYGLAFGTPAGLWWLRGRGILGSGYVSEALLVDPYQPHLGRANVADIVGRLWVNLQGYVGTHLPGGLSGYSGSPLVVVGILLTLAAVLGWFRRLRRAPSTAELFVPLYAALILLWPVVWSGDRFALPLYPFVLFYAGEALVDGAARWGRGVAGGVALAAVLLFVVPAGVTWWDNVANARLCREIVALAGPFACYKDRVREFVSAAHWSGENLPSQAILFTRKPRLFYTLTGLKSRLYPIQGDPAFFFGEARSQGVDWVIVDYLDELAQMYLPAVVRARAGAFCTQGSWGDPGGIRTTLLGILPPEEEERLLVTMEEEALVMNLRVCPESMLAEEPRGLPDFRSPQVPLLERNGR